jgi:hypothetical protein
MVAAMIISGPVSEVTVGALTVAPAALTVAAAAMTVAPAALTVAPAALTTMTTSAVDDRPVG